MKSLPIVVAVLAGAVIIRLALRRRGLGWKLPAGLAGSLAERLDGKKVVGDTGLVARREIRERIRGRMFRVVTVVLFAVVAAAVVIPTIHSNTTRTRRVGVVAGSAAIHTELQHLARSIGLPVQIVDQPGMAQARDELSAGRLDVVTDGTSAVLVKDAITASDTSTTATFVRAISVTFGAKQAYDRAGLTPQQATAVSEARPLPIQSIHPAKKARTTTQATALLGVILIFIVLTQYLTWTLMGVMEEKASRVVEVLLATVRPIQLLAGKVIGIGVVALAQAVALVAFALLLGEVVGSDLVHGAAPLVVVATLAWLVLGYSFYSWVYAAAGSLAERQDQVQSLALPLSAPLIFGYIVSLIGVSSGHPSTLVRVLAYVPPTAPFAMPTLVGFDEATWWQFLISVAVTLASTVLVALVAAQVYRTAVLRTGGRVRLRELAGAVTDPRPPPPG